MKKLFLSGSFLVLLYITGIAQTTTILFDKDAYAITPEAKTKLDSLIRIIKNLSPQQEICLVGHTDSDADETYNKTLSLNRATSVKDYFLSNGISNRIHIESKGESKLTNKDVTDAEKALNRRVQIIQDYKSSNTIFSSTTKEVQRFEINPNRDTLLTCKEGTKIYIDDLIFENTNASEPVIIQVQEYLTKSDFVLANLTTTHTDGRMIESRGMIYMEAFQNNKSLQIKEGKTIGILFKDRKQSDGTELFLGTSHNNNIVWNQNQTNQTFINNVTTDRFISGYSTARREHSSKKKRKKKKKNSSDFSTNYAIYQRSRYDTINGMPCKIVQKYAKQKYTTDTLYIANDPKLLKEYQEYIAMRQQWEYQAQVKKDMDILMLSSPKLGWINCDKFYENTGPFIDIVVEYQEPFVPSVVLAFKNINSVLPSSYRIDNKIIFKNVPENTPFDIIGLYNANGTTFLSQKSSVAREAAETISFIKVSPGQLKEALKNL